MQDQIKELNKQVNKHKNIIFYFVAGILSLTVAFGLGQCTAPIDRQAICKSYTEDITQLEGQLAECRRLKVVDCDERIRLCHEQEREACQQSLNIFRERCEQLACQE
tara:strand:- start:33 stop:353 length:321 start_codon:yes stop_codon:yes gene_type:complete